MTLLLQVFELKFISINDKKSIDAKHQRASKQEMQQVQMN
jgi:hypothetical protein